MPMGPTLKSDTKVAAEIAQERDRHYQKHRTDSPSKLATEAVQVMSIDELGDIFASLDRLTSFLPASLENWQTPSFVVLGPESSGKSSLLERLTFFSMFPRDEGICTRMAIKLELRRSRQHDAPTLQLVDLITQKPADDKPPRTITVEAGERDVQEAMAAAMEDLEGEVNESQMLVLRIYSPDVPSLNLIDLPGIVNHPPQHQAQTCVRASPVTRARRTQPSALSHY